MPVNEPTTGGEAFVTRALLRCGIVAGPFYLAVGVLQGLLRDGFDFARHPLSVLANGAGGWIQTVNFAVTGLLVLLAAAGFWRRLGRGSRALTVFLGAYGIAIFAAAIFPADPVDGFPPGTPEGVPTSISTTGLVHFALGALGFISVAVSGLVTARTLWRRDMRSLAILSLISGLCVLLGFFGGVLLPLGVLGIWFAVVVGWIWLSVMSLSLSRMS